MRHLLVCVLLPKISAGADESTQAQSLLLYEASVLRKRPESEFRQWVSREGLFLSPSLETLYYLQGAFRFCISITRPVVAAMKMYKKLKEVVS